MVSRFVTTVLAMQNISFNQEWDRSPDVPVYRDTRDYLVRNDLDRSCYLFSAEQLARTARKFQGLFPGEVSYAVKANPHPLVLDALWEAGVHTFDVASLGEIELVRQRFPFARLHYNNPVRSANATAMAHERYGIRSYVVDDMAGLNSVLSHGDGMEITVRFKLDHRDAIYDFGSKFGSAPEDAAVLLERAKQKGARTSLAFHPGSQCTDPLAYVDHIIAASEIAEKAQVVLYRLNVGGGFPVAYEPGSVRRVEDFFTAIGQGLDGYFPGARPELICEPGRALVASSVSLVAEVIHVRQDGDVFINDGVYGGFQEQTIMKTPLPIRTWREGRVLTSHRAPRTVFGPTCDPLDRLSVPFSLPVDIQPGDGIEFGLMGAYGSATTTRFNGIETGEYVCVETGFTDW